MQEVNVLKQETTPAVDVGSKNTLGPSEETLVRLGDYLKSRLEKLKGLRERSDWEREKARAFNAYHMIPKERPLPFPGAANFPCPLQRIAVDSFHANVMGSIFTLGTDLEVVPTIIQKDYANTAHKAAKYMTYVMNHEVKFYDIMDDAGRKAQMYGIGYLEPSYVKKYAWETIEVKEEKVKPSLDEMGQLQVKKVSSKKKIKKKRTVFDGIKVQSIPVESIYKSPFIKTIEQAVEIDAVFKVFNLTWDQVKDRSKSFDDEDTFYKKSQVDKIHNFVNKKIISRMTELDQARSNNDGFYLDMMTKDESIELAEAHCWWDIDGDGIREEITAHFHPGTGVVLRVSLTPCRIVEVIPYPIDERGYGEGIPKIMEGMADEWETFHNTRANAGMWENTTFGFYRAGGRLNMNAITIKPGQFYAVDDPREVQFAQPPRVGSSYFQEEQLVLSYFERVFALDENMQGVGSSRRRTATEALKVSTRGSIRFGNPFNRIGSSLNKLLDHIWELNGECAPEDKEFYVVGEGKSPVFDKMEKYEYNAKLKFSLKTNSVFDQQAQRDSMLLAYRLYMANPFVIQNPATFWELSQKTLDVLDIDIEIPKPDQVKTLSPFEEHEMMKRGQEVEPQLGEDYDHHYEVHMKMLNSDSIKEWDPEAIKALIIHTDKTMILKKTLESANLNKSGMFTNPNMPNQPGVTSNKNPTQSFNTMRVNESSNSQKNNAQVTGGGQNEMDQALGPI